MKAGRLSLVLALPLVLAALPVAAAQKNEHPVYWIDVATENQGIPMGGGGFLSGFFGKKFFGPRKELLLRIASPHRNAEPQGVHLVPEGFRLGPRLPLVTPAVEKGKEPVEEKGSASMEPPRGKILLYWGCGESIRKGQPRVIDTSKLKGGEAAKAMVGRAPSPQTPPAPRTGWIHARWPEGSKRTDIPSDASLVGEHRVEAGYLPVPIRFTLTEKGDFMAPLEFSPVARGKNGGFMVSWKPVPTATAYYAVAMAHDDAKGETILWSSSEVMDGGFGLLDYLSPSDVSRFLKEKVLLPPQTSSCTVPPVFPENGGAVLTMIAYGEEENIVHPPRPKDPKKKGDLDWSVKLRYKSTALLPLMVSEESPEKGDGKKEEGGMRGIGDAIRGILGL